ncbi:DNA recombination protein RmuC [Rhodospirillaceae bacterium SYSU D60014]|uniref:DNA recombination protein RmuC n=1 Tax=Virgifigura deserti TaxID=2268457 RepID=UPI000E6730CB
MDLDTALIIAALAAILGIGALLLLRRPADQSGMAVAELSGRLEQMAASQAAAQAALAERMQGQERALAKALDERLADLGKRVGDRLQESSQQAQQSMTDLKERLAVIDAAQKNITELSSQVVGLQEILANKQARGAFGEIQLQDLIQGVLPPSAFEFQATLSGGRRVDCLLRLPNPPGSIALDAKFPLESYRALREAKDEAATVQARRAFATAIRTHFRDIAERYIVAGETAESALMFLPSEAVYAELHANFPNVVEESFRHRVWIVSPTTLMATLTTVRAVLKDVRMREQADIIQTEVRTLLTDVTRLDDRVGKLQRHFDQATEDVRQIRISTEKVGKRAERIEELQLEEAASPPALVVAPAVGGN